MIKKKEQKKTSGRPCKATYDEKCAIIDAYFIAEGGDDPRIFLQHGIYTRLSNFYLAKKMNLYPHDFSRDEKIVAYIQKKASMSTSEDDMVLPAYTPLDIHAVLSGKSIKQQEGILREREEYFKRVYKRASVAIASYLDVSRQRDKAIQQFDAIKVDLAKAQEQIEALRNLISEAKATESVLKKENSKLRTYIRKNVEPELADVYLKGLRTLARDEISDVAAPIVFEPLSKLVQNGTNSVLSLWEKAEK